MTFPLKVYTLGGLTIQQDNTSVTGFISRKVEALFVYLLCDLREHPREVLAEFFWDDLPQARSLANLRMALSSLQQQLAPYLLVTRQTISIKPDQTIWHDAAELSAALDSAEQIFSRNGRLPRSGVAKLEEALKLYRGDFLAGFHLRDSRGFEDWKLMQQEHQRGRVIDALERVVQHHLEGGEYGEGIEQATRLLQLDPLREAAHRQMMRLQVGAGHRSAAAAQYETCRRILEEELAVEPDAETTALYQQIMQGIVEVVPPARVNHNLPLSTTPYIERPIEQAKIAELLDDPGCHLLTLVGAGGTGKTRLALHTALERMADYADGAYLVALAPVQESQHIVLTIAAALKLKTGEDPVSDLTDFLREKHMLLVLDNFEHVLDGVSILDQILKRTKWLKCIVTSRERLNLQEEWLLPIGGLDYPSSTNGHNIDQYGAVQLFVQSAKRVQVGFVLAGNESGISRICSLVEGMPLGVELAASWTRVMTCDQIAAQIERDLGFLETTTRNVPERHRSIRVLFEHSFGLLSAAEQAVLMRLSVFRGVFRLENAERVASATPVALRSLVEKSLIRSDGTDRYDIHQLLRRYAYEKLETSGQAETARDTHALYFTEFAEAYKRMIEADTIEACYDDMRAALSWAEQRKNPEVMMRLGSALHQFWNARGYQTEARRWLAQASAIDDLTVPLEVRAKALFDAGFFAWKQSDFTPAREWLVRALELYRHLESAEDISVTVMYLGYLTMNLGDHDGAKRYFHEMLAVARMQKNKALMARALNNLGLAEMELTNYAESKAYFEEALLYAEKDTLLSDHMNVILSNLGVLLLKTEEYDLAEHYMNRSLDLARQVKNKVNIMVALINLGEVAHYRHDLKLSAARYLEGLPMIHEVGDKLGITTTLEMFACLVIDLGNVEDGLRLMGAAEAQREILKTPMVPRDRERYDQFLDLAHQRVNDDAFQTAWVIGRRMGLDEAVAFALSRVQAP